jgi:hypothetical protein
MKAFVLGGIGEPRLLGDFVKNAQRSVLSLYSGL